MEEWNEFGELKENIGPVPAHNVALAGGQKGVNIAPPLAVNSTATGASAHVTQPPLAGINKAAPAGVDASKMRALPGAAEIAARNKAQETQGSSVIDEDVKAETMTSAATEKEQSIEATKSKHKAHLSAPASAIPSGVATPAEAAQGTKDEPTHEVEKIETEGVPKREDGDAESAAKAVEGMQVGDGQSVQQQDAKAGEDAGKSVED